MVENKKSLIAIIVFAVSLILLIVVLSGGLSSLGIVSLTGIGAKRNELVTAENNYTSKKASYDSSFENIETAEKNYDAQKKKYDSISDETVDVIKKSATNENYSIEYMWIKLGNYAKKDNLSIVIVEPGNDSSDTSSSTTASTITSDTVSLDNTTTKETPVATTKSSETTQTSTGEPLKIKVEGSYLNIADFIFALESDSELKFRIDNISMEYVSGTTISTTFEVKNVTISK